ncbi:MAG: TIGR02302 family protein [Siculibacillus sp.]|nr:TIGR02302 family protein [Siculibacillus sp.]
MNAAGQPSSARSDDLDRRIARAVGLARLAALWEVVWRRMVPILWVGGLHVAFSWLGLYAALPPFGRWVTAGLLFVALVVVVVRAFGNRGEVAAALDRGRAVRRVEAASRLSGHELVGLTDRLAGDGPEATRRLWAVHRARLEARVGRLAVGRPHPDLGRRDVFALRPLLGFALFIGWFAAGDDHLARLVSPFTTPVAPVAEDRLDAWIDPPAHTGRPPLVLIAEGRSPVAGAAGEAVPPVPQGSRLVVRAASGRADRPAAAIVLRVTPKGGAPTEIAAPPGGEGETAGHGARAPAERVAVLDVDAEVRLTREGTRLADWRITVVPDAAPTIRLVGRPEIQASGAMKLTHETGDDWGVTGAEARFQPVGGSGGRPLYEPPSFPLALPLGRAHTGTARTMRDVTAHPFAGSRQRMTLIARDEIGQEGFSETVELVLPQRRFRKPLARALVEMRRRLALDAGEVAVVITALDALTLAPERFEEKPGVHLGLRFLRVRAAAARDDDALREVADLLWTAATSIEDGDLADHEKTLRQAQEALRKALEEGASPEEIARLTRELREAMEKYLAAKAEQGRRETRRDPGSGPQRTITERDIRRMLDRIENLARTGSHEAAEKLLEELRELMENLQTGSAGEGGEEQSGGEALEKLGDMIHRQQKLMEDTHRSRREGEAGEDEGAGEMEALGRAQNELRDALRRFSEEMRGRGEGRGGEAGRRGERDGDGSDDLGEAADAMGRAGEALGRGEGEAALDAQTQALEGLRRGARKLGDRMSGRGEDGRDGDEDPFGRPRRQEGMNNSDRVKVPDEIDVERARRILDDIRKRLGEPARPKFERDYLDRLLRIDR